MRATTFVILNLLIVFLLVFGIAIFNYSVDGFGLFKNTLITKIAYHINNHKIVANLLNIDDRTLHKKIIETRLDKNEIIAIGSSRIMGIGQQTFSKPFFNHGMSGAILKDYLGIIGIYLKEKKYIPKTIIIGLDPWILNGEPNSRWTQLKEYSSFLENKILNKKCDQKYSSITQNLKELFSLEYTIYNARLLLDDQKVLFLEKECILEKDCFYQDGSHVEANKVAQTSVDEGIHKAKRYILSQPIYHLGGFTQLKAKMFENFIAFLKKQNIKIIFYLPPYHPIVYNTFRSDKRYANVLRAEDYFYSFAKKNHIQIIGSYNPNLIGISEKDFYDGMHLKTTSLRGFFKKNISQ